MNKLVQKYLILALSILIPLGAAFLVGQYAYNSEDYGQGEWAKEYESEYLSFLEEEYTTEDKLEKHIKYGINNQYHSYDETPVFSQTIQNESGKNLFKIQIYRSIYKTKVNDVEVERFQYLFLLYNVQYLTIREMFEADSGLQKQINEAKVPELSVSLYEILEDGSTGDEDKVTFYEPDLFPLPDYHADVHFISGKIMTGETEPPTEDDRRVTVYAGIVPMKDIKWEPKNRIEVKATIAQIKIEGGESLSEVISTFEVENLTPKMEDIDTSGYVESYQRDYRKTGYFSWVFKHYLWWICLIAFAVIGLITSSFYAVFSVELAKENTKKPVQKRKKAKN